LHENKKLKDIPRDELKTLVQKGLNHDRVTEKLTNANTELEGLGEVAKMLGYDTKELKEALLEQAFLARSEKDNLSIETVRKDYELSQKEKVSSETKKQQSDMVKFVEAYPNVKGEDITPETWAKVADGLDLVTAYKMDQQSNQLDEMKTKLATYEKQAKVAKQNEKAKAKSPVKATTSNGSDDASNDDFLQGLMG